jgi:hypothetical protein
MRLDEMKRVGRVDNQENVCRTKGFEFRHFKGSQGSRLKYLLAKTFARARTGVKSKDNFPIAGQHGHSHRP